VNDSGGGADAGGQGTGGPEAGPFRYHLELTPAQLKITHTALHSLLDDLGHDEADVVAIVREVLAKLPDEHAIRAIRLQGEVESQLESARPDSGDPEPPDSAA
jgi:hypothetical protein